MIVSAAVRSKPITAWRSRVSFTWSGVPLPRDSRNADALRNSRLPESGARSTPTSMPSCREVSGVSTVPRSSGATATYPSVSNEVAASRKPQSPLRSEPAMAPSGVDCEPKLTSRSRRVSSGRRRTRWTTPASAELP